MNKKYVVIVSVLGLATAGSAWSACPQHAKRAIASVPSEGIGKVVIHAGPGKLVVFLP